MSLNATSPLGSLTRLVLFKNVRVEAGSCRAHAFAACDTSYSHARGGYIVCLDPAIGGQVPLPQAELFFKALSAICCTSCGSSFSILNFRALVVLYIYKASTHKGIPVKFTPAWAMLSILLFSKIIFFSARYHLTHFRLALRH